MTAAQSPLDRVTSIKVKLGLLVAVSVTVAAVLATIGAGGTVAPWLSIPVTILVALAVTQLLSTGMTSPLRQMTQVARQMARGDYSGRVHTTSSDEVGELARAFNTMAEDLATVDRQRRDLVANVSHELRTPLAALCAVLDNLVDGVAEPDPAGLQAALDQAERLGRLVDDLLDLSRVDAGVTPLAVESIRVSDLLERAVAEAAVGPQSVSFEVRATPPDLTVKGDPARLRQLVANLLDNAAAHSPAHGTVYVLGTGTATDWWLEVADQGTGIAPENREQVFERFGTLGEQTGGQTGGTGLGLAIARWVTDLHHGNIGFIDPAPGESGARVRAVLPIDPGVPAPTTSQEAIIMATTQSPSAQPPQASPHPTPATADLFGRFWPEDGLPARASVLLAAVGVGVLAGWILPERNLGLGTFLVLMAFGATVFYAARNRRDPFTLTCAGLCVLLSLPVVIRDAEWIAVPCLFIGSIVCMVGLARGRSLPDFVVAAAAWPLAGLRGMPWLGRTLRTITGTGDAPAVIRTAIWSFLGLIVFGLLFASADALFAEWADAVIPDLQVDMFVARFFVTVAVAGVTLAAAYLALNPPAVPMAAGGRRPVQSRYEWLAPVALVDLVFLLFLVAQATAFFGGHDYLQRTTGLTYAEYVHQGFGQLIVATALTLLVVWAASHKASVETPEDRLWLRGALGLLCVLALVVVASALYRMHLYQEAYGFSQLRLLVDAFEIWLGLVVVAVIIAGIKLKGTWIPRMALLSSAVMLLGLAAINPDAWIARHNLDRYEQTGKIDWAYFGDLSSDAIPTVAGSSAEVRDCTFDFLDLTSDDDWLEWNLGRWRADRADGGRTVDSSAECVSTP
ncbi:MAG: DUF4153 domain-containing protein [Aeromicrobium sp.]